MNKYVIGTIVGSALLGLSKSKIGGRNKPSIVLLKIGVSGPYISNIDLDNIPIYNIPDDIKDIVEIGVSESTGEYNKIPGTALIDFALKTHRAPFPAPPSEDEEDYDDMEEEWSSECYSIAGDFGATVIDEIGNEIEHSKEYFQNCLKFIGNRNVYIEIGYLEMDLHEEEGWITTYFRIIMNSDNPLFALNFIKDLSKFLSAKNNYNQYEDIEVIEKPSFAKVDYGTKQIGPRLRKR